MINNDSRGGHIGFKPSTNFGDTIGRMPKLPLHDFIVDNLRRTRSWSVGLQYLEDALIKIENGGDVQVFINMVTIM